MYVHIAISKRPATGITLMDLGFQCTRKHSKVTEVHDQTDQDQVDDSPSSYSAETTGYRTTSHAV